MTAKNTDMLADVTKYLVDERGVYTQRMGHFDIALWQQDDSRWTWTVKEGSTIHCAGPLETYSKPETAAVAAEYLVWRAMARQNIYQLNRA